MIDTLPDEFIRKGLRFSQLRLMVALRDIGQVSGAAAQVAMTQPAASRLLADLEQMVGAKLYHRHPRGVTLTESGMALAARAQAILRQLDDTCHEITEIAAGVRGRVHIGAVTGPALEIVLPTIRELRVTVPEIEIAVQVDTSDKLAEALLAHELDFYIGRVPPGVDPGALKMREIGAEPVNLIVRADHPLMRRDAFSLEDCLAYDWVMQNPDGLLRRTAETYLLRNGYAQPARVLSTTSLLLTLAIISETNAIAPVARAVAEFYAGHQGSGARIEILPVAQDMHVEPYSLIERREMPSSAAARVIAVIAAKAGL